MAAESIVYCCESDKAFTLIKWKARVGCQLHHNSVLLSFKHDDSKISDGGKYPTLKYKSNVGGTVTELLVNEGDKVLPGSQLLKIEPCKHPITMKDLCAECGADLRNLDKDNFEKLSASTKFSMVHIVPELKVSLEQADILGQDDEKRLIRSRKLVLLVDLDQTLIHTTNENVPKDLPDVHHFQLYGPRSPWYHTKLRPRADTFLSSVFKYFELHICTFGARLYAHRIANILDPDRKLFSHRILSRDECFDPSSKTGNLKALFPRGDQMVCIIDDREDVWNYAPNVVHVKPYCFFANTGDINAFHLPEDNPSMNAKSEAKQNRSTPENSDKDICNTEENKSEESSACSKESIAEKKEATDCQEDAGSQSGKCEALVDTAIDDDYLLYLEDILCNIHKKYFEEYDKTKKETQIPDLKVLIPKIRKKILEGCNIVFSSVIPTNIIPETSRFWILAESLGARVTLELVLESDSKTTHVISSKLGTAKVNAAKKCGDIHIVNVDWLFSCAERWERINEKLFPLTKDNVPPFLDKHKSFTRNMKNFHYDPITGELVKEARGLKRPVHNRKKKSKAAEEENTFTERVFLEAGLALSQDDISDMDREIEEACSEESGNEAHADSSSQSSEESLSSGDYPRGWKKPKTHIQETHDADTADESDADSVPSVDDDDEEEEEVAVIPELGI